MIGAWGVGGVPPIWRMLEDVVPYNAAITKSTWTLAGGMFKVGLEGFKGIFDGTCGCWGGVYAWSKTRFF